MASPLIDVSLKTLASIGCALMLTLGAIPAAHAIVNGTETANFSAVGEIGSASGVLIAGNWVLTAGHVGSTLTAGSISFDSLAGSATIDGIYLYSNESYPSNDIALLHLSTAITAQLPVLNDQVVRTSQLAGLGSLTMVSAQNASANASATTKATSVLTTDTSDGTPHTVNWLVTSGNAHVQTGDSGGALFKGVVGDSAGALLLGVASANIILDSGANESAFVQVANYKAWINNTMASSGQQAVWRSSVPEPSTVALFVLAGAAALSGLLFARLFRHRQVRLNRL